MILLFSYFVQLGKDSTCSLAESFSKAVSASCNVAILTTLKPDGTFPTISSQLSAGAKKTVAPERLAP
jgi:hypothetical protein